MGFEPGHDWNLSPKEAIALQRDLAGRLCFTGAPEQVRFVAGVDAGFEDNGDTARAAVVLMRYPELEVVETRVVREPTRFPYVPGLLSFRELPAILAGLEQLDQLPDIVLCDGQGIAHPRRLGIAAHLGIVTGLASIGVGKSRFVGVYDEPGNEKGAGSPLYDGDECIGTVLRTRTGVKPVFVSPGYRLSQEQAVEWVLACTPRYRLPEPIRAADHIASRRGQ